MFTDEDVAMVRHVVQRILVPCVFVVGVLGNSVSVYVLTRKRMRCTTNIYLTALAITDIIYLTMALFLSLKHYDSVQRSFETYWHLYGFIVWLCDACAYISIYIAVSFTIERFIAIRYPLKLQTLCTEALAKKVLAGVSLFCLLSTISTAFEHKYDTTTKRIDIYGRPCNDSVANNSALSSAGATMLSTSMLPRHMETSTSALFHVNGQPGESDHLLTEGSGDIPSLVGDAHFKMSGLEDAVNSSLWPPSRRQQMDSANDMYMSHENPLVNDIKEEQYLLVNGHKHCENVSIFRNVPSDLVLNATYTQVWFFFTFIVFVLIPLCLLGTFNCFLIMLVRRSRSIHGQLTNANSIRRSVHRPTVKSSVSQENRITITLIAVVLLFIVCQLPWAIYLIVSEQVDIDVNLQAIIGNIFNFLAALNAAANFFLYCVLSDKYRKTVRELIIGYKSGVHAQGTVYTNSRAYRSHAASMRIRMSDGTNRSTRRNHLSSNGQL